MACATRPSDFRDEATPILKTDTIIWLDARCHKPVSKRLAEKFTMTPIFRTFECPKKCEEYIQEEEKTKRSTSMVIITSGSLGAPYMSNWEGYSCVSAFIIYCQDPSRYENLNYFKLLGAFHSEIDVARTLRSFLNRNVDSSSISLFSASTSNQRGNDLRFILVFLIKLNIQRVALR